MTRTIERVKDPEKESTECESERDDKNEKNESGSRLKFEFDDSNGIEYCRMI